METMSVAISDFDVPAPCLDGGASETAYLVPIPAIEHLTRAIREQRISDGYRRLMRAILDESWTPTAG